MYFGDVSLVIDFPYSLFRNECYICFVIIITTTQFLIIVVYESVLNIYCLCYYYMGVNTMNIGGFTSVLSIRSD